MIPSMWDWRDTACRNANGHVIIFKVIIYNLFNIPPVHFDEGFLYILSFWMTCICEICYMFIAIPN